VDTIRLFGGLYKPGAETSLRHSSSGAKNATTPGDNIVEFTLVKINGSRQASVSEQNSQTAFNAGTCHFS